MSSEPDEQVWIETWARRIETLGLSPVIPLLLELVRAFGFLGSQALVLAQPLMTGIVSETTLERTAALLDSPELLERLRARLEKEEG